MNGKDKHLELIKKHQVKIPMKNIITISNALKKDSLDGEDYIILANFFKKGGWRLIYTGERIYNQLSKMPDPYFEKGPKQREYSRAVFYVNAWRKWFKGLNIMDESLNRSHFHREQHSLVKKSARGHLWKPITTYNLDSIRWNKVRYRWEPLVNYHVESFRTEEKKYLKIINPEGKCLDVNNKGEYRFIDSNNYINSRTLIKTQDKYGIEKKIRIACECGSLVKVFDHDKNEWLCPGCGIINKNPIIPNDQPYETWISKNQTQKTKELKSKEHNQKGRHEHNKHNQSITLDSTLKEGLNLTKYERAEIKTLIKKINYAKLYGNKSKTVNIDIKTAAVSVYYLEEIKGEKIRVGRSRKNKFLKELGLTKDIYEHIREKIHSQLSNQ